MLKSAVLGISVVPVGAALASTQSIIGGGACKYIQQAGTLAGCTSKTTLNGAGGLASEIVNTILFAAGIVSFVFIVVGGIRYITSTGDASRIQSAKDTLLYAIIGLIVTFLAIPIAAFVIKAAGG